MAWLPKARERFTSTTAAATNVWAQSFGLRVQGLGFREFACVGWKESAAQGRKYMKCGYEVRLLQWQRLLQAHLELSMNLQACFDTHAC